MARRPRDIGTEAETWTVNYMRDRGWPAAERRKTTGSKDRGDINSGQPRMVVEVKADKALAYPEFLRQTEAERINAGAAVGVCVVKPPGVGKTRMDSWWMLMSSGTYDALAAMANWPTKGTFAVHWCEKDLLRQRAFNPGKVLAYSQSAISMIPDTKLRAGAKKLSISGWDMRFLYLPDGLQLLYLAGLGVD